MNEYGGVLLADGYAGYNGVVAGNGITRAGCWAHMKRKFVDAEKSAPEIARETVALVRALYAVERMAAERIAKTCMNTSDGATPAGPAQDFAQKAAAAGLRLALRREQAAHIAQALRQQLLAWKEQLLTKHPMAEAVNYALGQWTELTVFLAAAAVPLDNNASERAMKRIVHNRKNSFFVGNPRGGRTAAILSSLTSTCRRHEVDPQLYFTQLLSNLPTANPADLDQWLPNQWKLRHQQRLAEIAAN